VVEFLDNAPYRRIEATVDVGFKQGHRWIKMLGFELEGYMRAYRPDGADMLLYARVK
jgi:RimJ/RimL family protein N-acetyltransferase